MDKISVCDLGKVKKVKPDTVIVENGSNDLRPQDAKTETAGSMLIYMLNLLWVFKQLLVLLVHAIPLHITIMWPYLRGSGDDFFC